MSDFTVPSTPGASTSTATTVMPAARAWRTCGAIAWLSTAPSRIRSTFCCISSRIWRCCCSRVKLADIEVTRTAAFRPWAACTAPRAKAW
nr:hypothetical protein [Chromobacterium subtsugae]